MSIPEGSPAGQGTGTGRWKQGSVQGVLESVGQAHPLTAHPLTAHQCSGVAMDSAAFKVSHSVIIDIGYNRDATALRGSRESEVKLHRGNG